MPSPPSSVIVLDDSSDEEATTAASGRRSAPLLVSSSDESDTGRPSEPKRPRVASPKFSFTAAAPTARKGLSYASGSEEGPSDSQGGESDGSESSAPRGKKKKTTTKAAQKQKKNSAVQSSATADSDDYTHKEPTQLKFAASDGRMYSDAMSFSELQAQQREFERLQAKAHRASKSVPHNTARRTTTAGTKRKASDAVSGPHSPPHSRSKSSVMKKTTSPSPFDFDFPGSDEESSSSSSSSPAQEENRSSSRAKPMSLKDVVAQERELARLRHDNAKKISQATPPKKKSTSKQVQSRPVTSKVSVSKSSASKPYFSFFGGQKSENLIDTTEWSSSEPSGDDEVDMDEYKPKSSSHHEPSVDNSFSESDDEKSSDDEYMATVATNHAKSSAQRASEQHGKSAKVTKGKKNNGSKVSSKSKAKAHKSKARPSSAKPGTHGSMPAPTGVFSDKLTRPRTAKDTVMHSTIWRNVCFDSAPPNLLPLGSNVTLPFYSEFDRPLLTYDVDGDLRSKCKLLPRFGSSASALVSEEPEQVITQEDMDASVTEVIQRELPRIRACHQRKTTAILAEARAKVRTYLTAQEKLRNLAQHSRLKSQRLGDVDSLDRFLLNQMKQEKLTQTLSVGYANVWGETVSVEEKLFPQDINQLPNIRPLSRCTAYIGVKANVRVEDDPILRYMPYFGDNDDGADIDVAWYDAISPKDSSNLSSGLDGEVNEYLLRLVVRECGTSEKVFNALKKACSSAY
ncbi:Transcriptional repressor EZH1 [Phytophthora cinnamomi]|uniref:Transcriptional repressor EZH1 n=1 Tax=Phytophthora cinnamomi TaxID=4785 RepID=UPI00355A497C|nr:Transcriptional repressor EZH1 [Phytophthora cinnamomi]